MIDPQTDIIKSPDLSENNEKYQRHLAKFLETLRRLGIKPEDYPIQELIPPRNEVAGSRFILEPNDLPPGQDIKIKGWFRDGLPSESNDSGSDSVGHIVIFRSYHPRQESLEQVSGLKEFLNKLKFKPQKPQEQLHRLEFGPLTGTIAISREPDLPLGGPKQPSQIPAIASVQFNIDDPKYLIRNYSEDPNSAQGDSFAQVDALATIRRFLDPGTEEQALSLNPLIFTEHPNVAKQKIEI